jgi:predicted PurR-regulated permease PerM
MENERLANGFFFAIFFGLLYISYLMFKPYIAPLVFAGILAGTFLPINNRIQDKWKLSKSISSLITCFIIFLLVILPCVYIIYQLSIESINLYASIKSALHEEEVKNFFFGEGAFAVFIKKTLGNFSDSITPEVLKEKFLKISQTIIGTAVKNINGLLNNLFTFLFHFIVMFLATFAFLSEGHRLKKYMFELSPLKEEEEEKLLSKFNQMNYVSLYCNGIGGLIQGGLAGIGLYFVGISSVFFWTTTMVILAFIPLIGISVVTIPVSIYLFLKGKVAAAIIFFIFCAGISIWTENVFKPKFIGSRVQVDSNIMLFFILGGMSLFGMAGIFYGPIICILLLTIIELYHDNYSKI